MECYHHDRRLFVAACTVSARVYQTRVVVSGRVGLSHLVLSSPRMQRPVIIESASPAAPATLYCNASTHAAVAPIVSICGSAQLTFRNVIIEGCDDRTFLFGNNRCDHGEGWKEGGAG